MDVSSTSITSVIPQDNRKHSNFASLLSATADAYKIGNGIGGDPQKRATDGNEKTSYFTSDASGTGNTSGNQTVNAESNKFSEIQRIIAAELSNLDNAETLSSLKNGSNQANPDKDEDSEESQKPKKRKATRFKGVFRCGKKWKAQIQAHGVQHYLGLFETEEEAAKAYDMHARQILGVIKAKTNFPYDPNEVPLQPLQPSIVSNAGKQKASKKREKEQEEEEAKQTIGKRSYVGMKLRKLSEQRERKLLTQTLSSPSHHIGGFNQQLPSHTLPVSNTMLTAGALGQSLVHLPLQMAQNSYVMNNIPSSYTAVVHPTRFLNNEGFNSVMNGTTARSSFSTTVDESTAIDWSKHPYTPLEITGTYDPSYVPMENTLSEPDWRDQIYYWTGTFTYDEPLHCLLWKGTWIGSFSGKPSEEEFELSSNQFFYTSETVDRKAVVDHVMDRELITPLSGMYKGYYLMENNEGDMDRYNDKEFMLEFEPITPNAHAYNVLGRGDSEFGVFILNGTFDGERKVLDMCRQYVADADVRSTMTIPQLKQYFQRISFQPSKE